MKTRFIADPVRYRTMTTTQIRETFLIDNLCVPGEIHQVYLDLDRAVVGIAAPLKNRIALTADDTLRAKSFTERRELGVLNTGGSGAVHRDHSRLRDPPRHLQRLDEGLALR